jgi:serine protease Do
VITSFNGKTIGKMYELPRIVAEAQIGQTVPLEVWQKGQASTRQVLIGRLEDAEKAGLLNDPKHADPKKAPSATQAQKVPELGLTVAPLDAVAYRRYSIAPTVKGVVIVDIDGSSDAADKGLMPGDVVLEVNQQPVTDVVALKTAINNAAKTGKGSVLLLLNAQDDLRFVALKLQAAKH